jgi:hypothetical protein
MSEKESMEQSTAETLDNDMFLTSKICEGYWRWCTWVISGLFQNH